MRPNGIRRASVRPLLASAEDDHDGEMAASADGAALEGTTRSMFEGTPLDATIQSIGMGPYQYRLLCVARDR